MTLIVKETVSPSAVARTKTVCGVEPGVKLTCAKPASSVVVLAVLTVPPLDGFTAHVTSTSPMGCVALSNARTTSGTAFVDPTCRFWLLPLTTARKATPSTSVSIERHPGDAARDIAIASLGPKRFAARIGEIIELALVGLSLF